MRKTIPVINDTFMIFVIEPSKGSIHAINNTVGNGSYLDKKTYISLTSSKAAVVKEESRAFICVG